MSTGGALGPINNDGATAPPWNTPTQAPVARVAESPNLRRRWHAWHVEQSQLLLEGQKHRKRSPVFSGSHAAGEMDRSLVLFDEAAAHPKAQPTRSEEHTSELQ